MSMGIQIRKRHLANVVLLFAIAVQLLAFNNCSQSANLQGSLQNPASTEQPSNSIINDPASAIPGETPAPPTPTATPGATATPVATPTPATPTPVPNAPIITADPAVSNIATTSAKIAWTLNEPATGQVLFGTTTNYGSASTPENSFNFTSHSQSLTGLQANTTYNFVVVSKNAAGREVRSANQTFTTLQNPFWLKSESSLLCVRLETGVPANNSYLEQGTCDGGALRFTEHAQSDGSKQFRLSGTNFCLAVLNNSTALAARVGLATCADAANIRFQMATASSGARSFRAKSSSMCIDVTDAGWLMQYTCYDATRQRFFNALP